MAHCDRLPKLGQRDVSRNDVSSFYHILKRNGYARFDLPLPIGKNRYSSGSWERSPRPGDDGSSVLT